MVGGTTKNAALATAMAFHYQALIGLDCCFQMQLDQSVFFERDGDVSLVGDIDDASFQIEVKNYADSLSDNHLNFWKTINNWLAESFHPENYGALILHTTQPFGQKSTLVGWNSKSIDERIAILDKIFAERSAEEIALANVGSVAKIQESVLVTNREKLAGVIGKVILFTDAEDEAAIKAKISSKIIGIPESNKERYLQGLVGFVYGAATEASWSITKQEFDNCCVELTSTYSRKEFTFPQFLGVEASKGDIEKHEDALFIKKINYIEYPEVIPEAIGNWLELQNSLSEQLDQYPLYREKTQQYQVEIIKRFRLRHKTAKIRCDDHISDSQIFYNDTVTEAPINMGTDAPPMAYRNGLFHDAMNDPDLELHWWVGP